MSEGWWVGACFGRRLHLSQFLFSGALFAGALVFAGALLLLGALFGVVGAFGFVARGGVGGAVASASRHFQGAGGIARRGCRWWGQVGGGDG
ncbi:hypothetical protein CRI77_02490, partial [Mycolicibacterium duvalii]